MAVSDVSGTSWSGGGVEGYCGTCGTVLYRPHISTLYWQPSAQATVATEVVTKALTAWLLPGSGYADVVLFPFL